MTLTIALISDLHFGPDRGTKQGSRAKELFDRFKLWLEGRDCDLLVELGDRISDVNRETDERLMAQVGSWFSEIRIPRFHLPGNHDLEMCSLAENERLLNVQLHSRSTDLQGFHLVFWNAGSKLDRDKGFAVSADELEWLREDLATAQLPVVIFTHVPLDNGSMKGNFYFEKAWPHHAGYSAEDGERIRDVIERSGKVILCINGHAHWNAYHCLDGIHYITIPSLTEMFPTFPNASESWAELTLGFDIHLQVFGNLPIEYRLPMRKLGADHWMNMHKDYASKLAKPQ